MEIKFKTEQLRVYYRQCWIRTYTVRERLTE